MAPMADSANGYLWQDGTLRSWLLTTDHKRIALLYMASITAFFILGGVGAALIRLQLLVPAGAILSDETYSRMFTLHGVVMVWLFLVPSIPVTLGNFLVPLMLGARYLA
ncbi:MAG: cbb3-type cytochrome c oxidase subunit I, partial [Komagataeibacter saccharivorans]|uniref:cbb3-type cytochrome c oxidase subunit I n=1 Tax=Komagataeibacter saccharivorans TaxID=265959 RepID=UPI0039EA2E86